jgi:hypothetical protein
MLRGLAILTLLAAAGAVSASEPAERVELSGPNAVAYTARGSAMFRGDLPFLLSYVETEGEIFEARDGKVRISPDGTPEVWLRCSDLQGVASCADQPAAEAPLTRAAGIPNCPGDPRCPKKRPK